MNGARLMLLVPLCIALACAGTPERGARPMRADPTRVTSAELAAATQVNLHSYLMVARPRWLESTRTTGFDGRTSSVSVFVDGQRFGDVESLRNMSLPGVIEIRYYGVSEAQQRFNSPNIGSVINVITR